MDDPISALDAHVRLKIINNVFFGVLKNRTRILVTHAIDFLDRADHIIIMDKGSIQAQGTFAELQNHATFKEMMVLNKINKSSLDQKEEGTEDQEKADQSSVHDHLKDSE